MGEYRKLTTNKGKEVIGIIKSLRGIKNTNRLPPQAIKYDRHFCRLKIKNVVSQSIRMAHVSERGRGGKGREGEGRGGKGREGEVFFFWLVIDFGQLFAPASFKKSYVSQFSALDPFL